MSKSELVLKFNAIDGENGDDALDSLKYLLGAMKEIATDVPRAYFVNEQIGLAQKEHVEAFGEEITDPTRLRQIAMRQTAYLLRGSMRQLVRNSHSSPAQVPADIG